MSQITRVGGNVAFLAFIFVGVVWVKEGYLSNPGDASHFQTRPHPREAQYSSIRELTVYRDIGHLV